MRLLLAMVYAVASVAQLVVGKLLDRFDLKSFYLTMLALQIPFLVFAAYAEGWTLYSLQVLFMIAIFGSIPFTEAMIVRFVDDRMRSRVAGVRLAISLGASSAAVWLLGPVVKQAGFTVLLWIMAALSALTIVVVMWLPNTSRTSRARSGATITAEA